MQKQKKIWSIPQLIVLVRGKQEEAVLVTCKSVSGVSGPAFFKFACSAIPALGCGSSCNSVAPS